MALAQGLSIVIMTVITCWLLFLLAVDFIPAIRNLFNENTKKEEEEEE